MIRNIFFTSDTHFSHANIIKYSKRPFKDKDEMNEHIIRVWNERVQPNDVIYHLGDFAFATEDETDAIISRLNGKKFLIWGNHDKLLMRSKRLQAHFVRCLDYLELKVRDSDAPFQDEQMIVLFHFPMVSWNKMHRGSWHLHGHCHHNLRYPFRGRILDVGVDGKGYNYGPISYAQVKVHMKSIKEVDYLDHHSDGRI